MKNAYNISVLRREFQKVMIILAFGDFFDPFQKFTPQTRIHACSNQNSRLLKMINFNVSLFSKTSRIGLGKGGTLGWALHRGAGREEPGSSSSRLVYLRFALESGLGAPQRGGPGRARIELITIGLLKDCVGKWSGRSTEGRAGECQTRAL